MNKFIISGITSVILMQAPTLSAAVMCERSFTEDFQIDLDINGTLEEGTLEGEFDTQDKFDCGDEVYLRGMYSRVSETSWHFFFATAGGDTESCPAFFFDGIWEGSAASSGQVYTNNGESFGDMDLSIGVCEFVFIPPIDPIGPIDPIDPIGPLVPIDPILPIDPIGPLLPIDPIGPLLPIDPILPIDPLAPIDPILPIDPLLPIDPFLPIDPSL